MRGRVRLVQLASLLTVLPAVFGAPRVGAKVGLFAVSAPDVVSSGHADWDWFRVEPG